jgi:DNA-binding Lrp family transcriptional regulator
MRSSSLLAASITSSRAVSGDRISLSLRRHDPDQVRWVGLESLSARASRAPHEIADNYLGRANVQGKGASWVPNWHHVDALGAPCQRSLILLDCRPWLYGLRRLFAMTPFFVQIKCDLGKSYDVANALAEAEIASEIYSTAGDYDLLVKFYVDQGTDIGHFVNEKVQTLPGIKDTYTIITFKAFTA